MAKLFAWETPRFCAEECLRIHGRSIDPRQAEYLRLAKASQSTRSSNC
jgi:hypothetical protein